MRSFLKCEVYFRNDCGELINVGAYCTAIPEDWIQGQGSSGIMDLKQPMGHWLIAQVGPGACLSGLPGQMCVRIERIE